MRRMRMRYRVLVLAVAQSEVGDVGRAGSGRECADDDGGSLRGVERKSLTHVQASVSERAGVDVYCGQGV